MPGDTAVESPEAKGAPVRRSGRQAKRTDKLEEFLVTVKRGRGTGRRSAPAQLEGGDPPSQTPTDAETASEASFDGNVEAKAVENKAPSPVRKTRGRGKKKAAAKPKGGPSGSVSDDGSSENEEEASSETSKEVQEEPSSSTSTEDCKMEETVKEPKEEEDAVKQDEEKSEEIKEKPAEELTNKRPSRSPAKAAGKDSTPAKREPRPKAGSKSRKEKQEDEDGSSSSESDSDSDGYDPNALYCICRQKHNKRFMICCDRCEEWFHGDCVGITEARGRLMERNGEDYVCPNCTGKKVQTPKPAATAAMTENGKRPAPAVRKVDLSPAPATQPTTPTPSTSAPAPANTAPATEEKPGEDLGIKGRIEKATNPSGKKKIKIFQPQAIVTAEESSLPKCIGPGCERDALPDSVYCGNDCILKHAAAAMKTITTDGKETKPKEKAKPKAQKKTATKSTPKKNSAPERRSNRRSTESSSKAEEESSESEAHENEEDEDEEDKLAEEHPPPPAMSSWSSDHNYIAVTPEKTTPISPTVLNKASGTQKDKEKEKDEQQTEITEPEKKDPPPVEKKPPSMTKSPKGGKKSPGLKSVKSAPVATPKGKASTTNVSNAKDLKKHPPLQTKMGKSKKPGPPPPPIPVFSSSGPPGSRIHATGALSVAKSTFTIPKKQPQGGSKESAGSGPSPTTRTPPAPMSSTHHGHPPPSKSSQPAAPALPPLPPPNNQMRSNIRRSLTDILYKRVSDSDDLSMTESEVGRLAVSIEKEMFNLYMNTDSKYKNKYRSLMFNLKDPKNKGLFYRVVGGEVSPFRLVRLSPEELLSKDISDWRKSDTYKALDTSGRSHSGRPKAGSKHEGAPPDVDMEDAPSMSDGEDHQESHPPATAQESGLAGKSSAVPDILSSMLKDTTAEHRAHLFDLNCKICTGQRPADDEPVAKKPKMSVPKKQDLPEKPKSEQRPPKVPADLSSASYSGSETPVPAYQQSVMEESSSILPIVQTPAAIPAVSSVTITRRDPRTASHRSSAPLSQTGLDVANPVAAPVTMPTGVSVSVEPPVVEMKGPLPMPPPAPVSVSKSTVPKPVSSTDARHCGASTSSVSEPPPEGETALFLSGQEMMWKGFINMHAVAKFVTKAYLVSGSFEHLKEDLPDTIHIGGRISPHTVWDYVGKLKTSLSKELCLIRFHPATEEEEVAYVSLFSYFSSRKRFGVVANSNKRIKDLYLIPLSSKDPLPAKLLPFDGPGLEPARPNLLLGLLICQKDKKRTGAPLESEEKRPKTLRDDETGLPKPIAVSKTDKAIRSSLESVSTTPPGTPPPLSSLESSLGPLPTSSVFSILSSVKAPGVTTSTGSNSPSTTTSSAVPATTATPLQTILKTLFGKKKQDSEASQSPSDQSLDVSVPLLDPIVQQFGITKGKKLDEEEDDRPYDPEEEYDPSVGYGTEKPSDDTVPATIKQPDVMTGVVDDIAYDPEDDSIFEDVKVDPGSKKQQEEQEESQHTQLPDALIAQPPKSLLANSQLLQLGKKVEELVGKSSANPVINQRRDPRQSRDPRQASATRRLTSDSAEKEESSDIMSTITTTSTSTTTTTTTAAAAAAATTTITDKPPLDITVILGTLKSQQSKVIDTPTQHSSEETTEPCATTEIPASEDEAKMESEPMHPPVSQQDTSRPEEDAESEEVPFLDADSTEISIPLLGEKIDPELVDSYMEPEPKPEEKDAPIESESKSFEEIWPNSASILKAEPVVEPVSSVVEPVESTPTTYYNISTISTPITSIGVSQDVMDSPSSHLPHMTSPNSQNEYRGPPDIPPPVSFPPPMLGPPPMPVPPPMHIPPPVSGPPPMQGPPPIQGPPPMQIAPPMQGLPPSHRETDLSQYPPPGPYPPYQNQWGNSPQFDASRGPPPPIITPRGPLPPMPPMSQRVPPPQIYNSNIPPQPLISPRGPLPGPPPAGPPLPTFDGQRFNGPPPPFNFTGPRGPLPPFTGPPLGHFDSRAPPPSHFPGPRGPPPLQNIAEHGPPPNIPRGPGDQYDNDSGSSYQQGMEQPQTQTTTHSYRENQGPSHGPAFRGPPPNHFDGRRGPPGSVGDMSGHRFPPPSQFRGSPQHRGSFDEPRGGLTQDFERHRAPAPQQFGAPRGPPPGQYSDNDAGGQSSRYHFDDHSNDIRPIRGPLLPTPPEGPLPVPGRLGGHSPESHRDEHWRRHSPEVRRRSSCARDGSEPQDRSSRFDSGPRDRDGPSRLSEERQRDLSEDRRRDRDRDRDGSHGGRPWSWNRDREWDRGRERDREGDRSRDRERERDRSRDRERDRDRSRERERERDRSRERDRRDTDRHREGDGDKRRDRDRERDRDRGRDRESDRKEHDRDRGKNRERDRDRDRDRDNRDKRRERTRSRERDRGKDRDRRERDRERDRDREREKDRDRRERSRSKDRKEERKEKSETSKDIEKSADTESAS
ncbi:hypothetical protein SRHO_G00269340 [Serrasalmus rhombeus]